MRRLFRFKYPKLALLILASIASYALFSTPDAVAFVNGFSGVEYAAVFIAGMLFSFGFTTPFSVGFFLTITPSSLPLAALVGGLGALLSDVLIFHTIKFSFMDEFRRLRRTGAVKKLCAVLHKDISARMRNYALYVFAGMVIASPLPDELGVSMLAGLSHIRPAVFAALSFACNVLGVLAMLCL